MDELMDQVMDVKAAMDLAIYIYDLAVQGMGKLDSVLVYIEWRVFKFWLA